MLREGGCGCSVVVCVGAMGEKKKKGEGHTRGRQEVGVREGVGLLALVGEGSEMEAGENGRLTRGVGIVRFVQRVYEGGRAGVGVLAICCVLDSNHFYFKLLFLR